MCGIFGIICCDRRQYSPGLLEKTFFRLAKYSESRGKESCGFALRDYNNNELNVFKGALPISAALRNKKMISIFDKYFNENITPVNPIAIMGHARLVTNGIQIDDFNNQPVIKDGIVGVHNGIIVNANELWSKHLSLKRNYSIDTEAFLAIVRYYLDQTNNLDAAFRSAFNEAVGTVSTAIMFKDYDQIFIGANNGSLYFLTNDSGLFIFASEKYILEKLLDDQKLRKQFGVYTIAQVKPNTGYFINPFNLSVTMSNLKGKVNADNDLKPCKKTSATINYYPIAGMDDKINNSLADINEIMNSPKAIIEKGMLESNYKRLNKLIRCAKCILPHTFPFIEFDEKGVCNYCRSYIKKNQPKPVSLLKELVEPYRSKSGNPDCLIPFSGGRDSSFALHYIKNELKLNPITFTYDWGMVTDLARRNIARICGKLGVENIIVSADISWKRKNIRKNILAWLKNPQLGMIPLFMAGDKYFFYYAHQIKKQTGIKLNIWGINPLENTDFKVGFAGVPPQFNKKRIYSLNYSGQIRLLYFIAQNFIKSPSYINQSIIDTFGSYFVRYFYPKKDYYHFYDYFQWDEKMIESTIINEYGWELAVDTKSTWRIGDGTASFYNYVYHTIAGFSENDTFRSNQIREGIITRDEAIIKVEEENTPRYETIKWYLDIIGLDFETVIKKINNIPKLY